MSCFQFSYLQDERVAVNDHEVACQLCLCKFGLHLSINMTGKILMISKTALHSYQVTFESTFIFGPLCIWRKFLNYKGKTNETNIPRVAVLFSLGMCVYMYMWVNV